MELSVEVVRDTNRQEACFFCDGCCELDEQRLSAVLFSAGHINLLTHTYAIGADVVPVRYFCGGPRFPKTSMVTSVPVFQIGAGL
ncbi:hypothetical protein BH11BAC3_BH11BAC3_02370 [soil metagenome]